MNRRVVLVLSVLALMICTSTVFAQRQKGRKGAPGQRGRAGGMMMQRGGRMMANPIMLLRNEAVRDELKVTDDQQAKLQELATAMRGAGGGMQALRDLPAEERRTKMRAMREEMEKRVSEMKEKVAEILNKEQMTRLEQIQVQAQVSNPMALLRGPLAEKLGITEEQRQKAREVIREAMGGARGGDRAAAMAKMREAVMGLMTADQKEKYKEMAGEPFDVSKLRPAGRAGGGRPGKARKRGPDA